MAMLSRCAPSYSSPLGERVARPQGETGEGALSRTVQTLLPPHPALRATFSPTGRRIEAEALYGTA